MGRANTLLLLAAGCSFELPRDNYSTGDASTDIDAGVDPLCESWDPLAGHVAPCADHFPAGADWTIEGQQTYDTTGDGSYSGTTRPPAKNITQSNDVELHVITVKSLTIPAGAKLRVVGARPLLILSWSTIDIAGELDASSRRAGSPSVGAGGTQSFCSVARDGEGNGSSGGGGGGGFGEGGGSGGNGDDGEIGHRGGMFGGSLGEPLIVVGGCGGGDGGSSTTAGAGGAGGGAVQLTAKDAISVSGGIHAGGQGGQGGQGNGGGGGGGSGGYVGLDTPSVTLEQDSFLAANGGGGGTGCAGSPNGVDGDDGKLGSQRANGGKASTCTKPVMGGRGGAGISTKGEDGAASIASGGGGGGGVGYIFVWAANRNLQGMTSPAITIR